MNERNHHTVEQSTTTDPVALLTGIMSEHLGGQEVGPDDDFYALGGDSLIALRVVMAVQERGIAMTLKDLLFHPTVRELAGHLATSAPAAAQAPAEEGAELLDAGDRVLVPDGVAAALPASALQVGIIYLCDTSGDPELYHSIIGWETVDSFDEQRFREALSELCDRHAALRTSFDLGTYSESVQLQWEKVEPPLTVERIGDANPAKGQYAIRRWSREGLSLPIDWSKAPLFRCHVVAQPDTFHVAIASHHAIVDGWSYGRLIVDLLELYAAKLRGQSAALPQPPAQGERDFIVAERELLASHEAADFWHRQADTEPLLFARGQFHGAANAVASAEFTVDGPVLEGLRAAARDAGISLKSLALAAHARALSAWTGRDDIVTGVVVNTRPERPGADLMVGLYLNTVPLCLTGTADPLPQLGRRAHELERDAAPHRGYPLAQIESRLGRPPFDVTFNFMNFHVYQDLDGAQDLQTRAWWVRGKPSFPFRVDFEVDGAEAGSRVSVAYDPELLDEARVRAYARHFEAALTAAAGGTT
ncbi:condensation domain-containing protein [Streptomyces sp. NPDC005507]|uniref:condensation domain-containing protein n=1 Tax=Streptomyces sp. NPDC005507 TaxID=3154885 RepID=UPI0033A12592